MTKITNIFTNKPRLKIVKTEKDTEYDMLLISIASLIYSANASRQWTGARKQHLLNCRDALDRTSFYLNDEINKELDNDS